jgi:hypothetical protein
MIVCEVNIVSNGARGGFDATVVEVIDDDGVEFMEHKIHKDSFQEVLESIGELERKGFTKGARTILD